MATGDKGDMEARLRSLVPSGWFARISPVRHAVFGGLSDALANSYALLAAVRAQTRLFTSSGWFIDLRAWDLFGAWFLRRAAQDDADFALAIRKEFSRERVTRKGIATALQDLTGRAPGIVEPWNAGDCGAYDLGGLAYAGSDFSPAPVCSYDQSGAYDIGKTSYDPQFSPSGNSSPGMGCWGSLELPFQLFVNAYRPLGGGIVNASGTDIGLYGYDIGSFRYIDESEVTSPVSDADILAAVDRAAAGGIVAWTAISD